ncbi:hypothetical protein FSP39_004720 [Pinctada imbricata]|uniref:Uncharacterized protein n=1 Tax=Pinctada imbricata TaxID=66713 RepID=A0AA88YHN4_PINIB|nr:hypothetical protein FSP39_004720 [Pinctada imbricata]
MLLSCNHFRMWIRAVWTEGDHEEEGVVPACWVKNKMLYWPPGVNAERAMKEKKEPSEKWKKFPVVKIKLQSDDRNECEDYDWTTTQEVEVETEDEMSQRKRKKKKTFDDFITEQGILPKLK